MSSSQSQCERLHVETVAFLNAMERINALRSSDSTWKAGITAVWREIHWHGNRVCGLLEEMGFTHRDNPHFAPTSEDGIGGGISGFLCYNNLETMEFEIQHDWRYREAVADANRIAELAETGGRPDNAADAESSGRPTASPVPVKATECLYAQLLSGQWLDVKDDAPKAPPAREPAIKERPLSAELAQPATLESLANAISQVAADVDAGDTDAGRIRFVVGRLIECAEKAGAFNRHHGLRAEFDGRGCAHYLRKLALWLDANGHPVEWDKGSPDELRRVAESLRQLVVPDNIKTWLTVSQAAKKTGATRADISGACRGPLKCRGKGRDRLIDPESLRQWMKVRELKAQVGGAAGGGVHAHKLEAKAATVWRCTSCKAEFSDSNVPKDLKCPGCRVELSRTAQRCATPTN